MVHLSRSHCRCQDNTLDGPLICFIVKFEYFEFTGWEQIQNSQYDTYMYDETRLAEPVKILPSLHPPIHYAGTNVTLQLLHCLQALVKVFNILFFYFAQI